MPYSKECPYCGGTLRLDETKQTARCDDCGSDLTPEELLIQREEEVFRLLGASPKEETERDGFLCENCGAQFIADEAFASTFCCYCGAPAVVSVTVPDTVEPDLILPFAFDRGEAQDRFARWFGRKKLIPPDFLETVKAGRMSGLYVPFWLFDCAMETHLHAASSSTETIRSEKTEIVTAKDCYHYRCVQTAYTNVPAAASERMDGRLMDLLGPFDLTRLEPFDPAYMEGFCAEKHSLTAEQLFGRVREQLEGQSMRVSREALDVPGYANVKTARHIYREIGVKYALFPVWTVNVNYGGFTHQFFMNGQTGKIVGEAPLSITRVLQWFGGVAAGVAAAGELLWIAFDKLL